MSVVRRHPLITFFVLTYALTWWAVPFGGFISTGPLLAALIVIPITQGLSGLRDLGSRMIRWRVGWYWYVVAIGLPLAVLLVAVALNVALGAGAPSLAQLGPLSSLMVFAVLLTIWHVPLFFLQRVAMMVRRVRQKHEKAYSMDLREKVVASVKKGIPESEAAYTTPRSGGCDHGA